MILWRGFFLGKRPTQHAKWAYIHIIQLEYARENGRNAQNSTSSHALVIIVSLFAPFSYFPFNIAFVFWSISAEVYKSLSIYLSLPCEIRHFRCVFLYLFFFFSWIYYYINWQIMSNQKMVGKIFEKFAANFICNQKILRIVNFLQLSFSETIWCIHHIV